MSSGGLGFKVLGRLGFAVKSFAIILCADRPGLPVHLGFRVQGSGSQ